MRKAYFTVEAALVLPLTLGVIIFLIYIMFYQYDRCLLDQDMGILAMRGAVSHISDKELLLRELQEQEADLYRGKYIAFQEEKTRIRLSGNHVLVESKGCVYVPFSRLPTLKDEHKWQISAAYRSGRISPALFVRTCMKLLK